MFDATETLARTGSTKYLSNYFRTRGFTALVTGLTHDKVPEDEIMRVSRGRYGRTYLHKMFLLDFLRWTEHADAYYKATKKHLG